MVLPKKKSWIKKKIFLKSEIRITTSPLRHTHYTNFYTSYKF